MKKSSEEKIKTHDAALLREETFLKFARAILAVLCCLFLAWVVMMAPTGFFADRMDHVCPLGERV